MTIRLPAFDYLTPETLEDAAAALADPDRSVIIVAGGTDVVPKMKRRQMTPEVLVSLSKIESLRGIRRDDEGRCVLGASTTLAEIHGSSLVPEVFASAAGDVASPQIRNTATLGGNLSLDTRCNYIDMSDSWRQASGYCLKDGGDTCWVAPRSNKCWAISSSDLATVALALGGSVKLTSVRGERMVPVEELYNNDGIAYSTQAPDEILVELVLPKDCGRATYQKLRRRGSIDFPLLGVAAVVSFDDAGVCASARIVVGAVASAPLRATEAEEFVVGRSFTKEVLEEAGRLATQSVRPQDNTDTGSRYRKWMVPVFVEQALRAVADTSE
ncbi:MAG TPA: 4-hydroxybenzoyl-CoA reductase [Actinobacteria bacterium]|nr:4-hydroxybenzoyl-CoA reductase subunit beta [bacterium BMS3Bbin02]HDL41627.1 4-hydroxybenzoyl-CoA reductase [Actinomycetota bacterium]